MDYTTFTMELMELLHDLMKEDAEITLEKVPKNNGITLDGMIFRKKDCQISPVLYVQDFYELWQKGMPMEQLATKILWCFEHCQEDLYIPQDFFQDYKNIRSNIYFKVINYHQNKNRLADIPHKRILDLAMVFYYLVEEIPATILISNSHLRWWNISKEVLEMDARRNTYFDQPVEFISMKEFTGSEGEESPMYIVTNQERKFGAGVIFYPGVMEAAAELFKDNFFILPSSVHECILLPDDGKRTQEELAYLVTDINEHCVDPREILSDRAYYYRLKDGCIHL